MPIYEYRCTDCGAETEVIQKASDAPLNTCETCAGRLQKLISQSAFQFRGSGWYVTDYARKAAGGNKKSESGDGVKSETSESSKQDSATTAKVDSQASSDPAKKVSGEAAETKKATPATTPSTA